MLLTLRSTQTLTAVMSGAAATTNPTYSIDTVDLNLNSSPATTVGSLSGATAVTLASAPLQVRSLSICNIDTAAVTVTLKESVAAKTITSMTLAVGDTLVLDDNGISVIDVNGNVQSSAVASSVDLADDADIVLGTDDDALIRFSAGDVSNPSLVVALDNTSQALHITDKGAVATDWNLSADTHPTVYLHSNTTPTTDYLKVGAHDGTTALIDVVGGTTLAIKAAGNEIVELVQTASATNGLKITSTATGDPVRIGANGTGATANRGMILDDSNGNESIIMVGTASAVNEITITNNAAGSAPIIAATGGDTDINLSLTPKGAGAVVATAGFVAKSPAACSALQKRLRMPSPCPLRLRVWTSRSWFSTQGRTSSRFPTDRHISTVKCRSTMSVP